MNTGDPPPEVIIRVFIYLITTLQILQLSAVMCSLHVYLMYTRSKITNV